jgi:hypothetical protein
VSEDALRCWINFFELGDREEARHRVFDSQPFESELLDTPLLEIPLNFDEFMMPKLTKI